MGAPALKICNEKTWVLRARFAAMCSFLQNQLRGGARSELLAFPLNFTYICKVIRESCRQSGC
jgi:hypothetical protein